MRDPAVGAFSGHRGAGVGSAHGVLHYGAGHAWEEGCPDIGSAQRRIGRGDVVLCISESKVVERISAVAVSVPVAPVSTVALKLRVGEAPEAIAPISQAMTPHPLEVAPDGSVAGALSPCRQVDFHLDVLRAAGAAVVGRDGYRHGADAVPWC